MSSIFSTQNRHTFLRRKYCFLVASALSPPVGLIDPLMGRPPRCSAMLFSRLFSYWRARHGSSRPWTSRFGCARHDMLERHARRGRRRRFAGGPLFAFLLAFLDLFQFLVDAHILELHHQVRNAQAAFHLQHRLRLGGELQQDVVAFVALLDAISQLADAPFVGLVHIASLGGDVGSQLFDQMIDLFFRRFRPENKQLFVDPHSSSFKPWARRLYFAMDFSTPSAMMDSTASEA